MSAQSDKSSERLPPDVAEFIDRLSEEERMLVILCAELYDGSWESMMADLKGRLEGKPYVFKLANRINDDIARIQRLSSFEREHNISLADYIKGPV